jgi:regulator of sigma D
MRNTKVLLNWFTAVFSSIFNVFAKSNANNAESNQSQHQLIQSNTTERDITDPSIPFYPKLIDHLEMDHQHLLLLYTDINSSLEQKKYALIPGQLHIFKNDLKAHLDTENIKFYGYLEQRLKDQSEEFISLRRFRKEMRAIERTVIKFLDHWIEYGVQADSLNEFKTEYNAIGAALIKRIESEEKELYTLYSQI